MAGLASPLVPRHWQPQHFPYRLVAPNNTDRPSMLQFTCNEPTTHGENDFPNLGIFFPTKRHGSSGHTSSRVQGPNRSRALPFQLSRQSYCKRVAVASSQGSRMSSHSSPVSPVFGVPEKIELWRQTQPPKLEETAHSADRSLIRLSFRASFQAGLIW